MYRIRSASGSETVYGSLEEFSAAVKRGEVSPEAEIFHTRANRWLDIKTHPHYRIALGMAQGTGPGGKLPDPVGVAAPPEPSSPSATRRDPGPGAARVLERPPLRSAPGQTTVRPALNGTPTATVVEPPRPQKTRELTFLEVDEAPRRPAPPGAKPDDSLSGTELGFLAPEQGGTDRPKSSSGSQKVVPGDLDLLFDSADSLQVDPPKQEPPSAPKPLAPRLEPRRQAVAAFPAVKLPEPRKPEVARPEPPKQAPASLDQPKPAPAVAAPEASRPEAERVPETLEAGIAGPDKAHLEPAKPAPSSAPAEALKGEPTGEDLEIPPFSVREAAVQAARAAPVPAPPPAPRAVPVKLLAGAIAAALVAGALVLLWRPWTGTAAATPRPGEAASETPAGPELAAPAPAPNSPAAEALAGTARPVPPEPVAAAPGGPADQPSAPGPAEEKVIAAARPSFRAELDLSAAQVRLTPEDLGGKGTAIPPSELAHRFEAAQQQAQQELLGRLTAIGFNRVVAPSRLGSADAVAAARSIWIQGAGAIREYRGRIARIADAYEDSLLASQRSRKWPAEEMRAWSARQSLSEPAELTQLSDLMFTQVTEALEILAALSGEYQIRGNAIAFKHPASATRYTSIRNWVAQRLEGWNNLPESARPVTISPVLRALGDGLPAAE